ncbi:MAG: TetR-like C-terminal domain-containing protein [Steroidobacteraceae bacterium]
MGDATTATRTGRRTDELGRLRQMIYGYVRWARARPARFKLTFGPSSQTTDELKEATICLRSSADVVG